MKRFGWATAVVLTLLAPMASGCVRTDEGVAVRGEAASSAPTRTQSPTTKQPTEDAGPAVPGIVATSRAPLPPDAVTCSPPIKPAESAVAQVSDPAAPKITVAVPSGWSVEPGAGDVGLRLLGPEGMFATVSITKTQLEPAEAFTEYADNVMAKSAVSSVSVLPAELCGYSGQKLMGAWSDTPQQSVEFLDRIVHIWTDDDDYLVAVHVQAPASTDEFDSASTVLVENFAVGIP